MDKLGVAAAVVGVLAHLYFVFLEMFNWNLATVRRIASPWLSGMSEPIATGHVDWARKLAFNVGAYNLVLALGLAWSIAVHATDPVTARSLWIFFGVWLIIAAAAALYTRVISAFVIQGLIGVVLLIAAI